MAERRSPPKRGKPDDAGESPPKRHEPERAFARSASAPARDASDAPPRATRSQRLTKSDETDAQTNLPISASGSTRQPTIPEEATSQPAMTMASLGLPFDDDWSTAGFWDSVKRKSRFPMDMHPIYNYPVSSRHPIAPYWDFIRNSSCQLLDRKAINWGFVGNVNRRFEYEPEDTTVTVLVVISGNQKHAERLQLARELWAELQSMTHEVGSGDMITAVASIDVLVYGGGYGLCSAPAMTAGDSVHPERRPKDTGTFGGYVRIRRSGADPIIAGLTCHHVACPDDRRAVRFTSSKSASYALYAPAECDYEERLAEYNKHQRPWTDPEAYVAELRRGGTPERAANKGLIAAKEAATKISPPAPPAVFGHLWGSSGLIVIQPENCGLDWAIIRLEAGVEGHNTIQHDRAQRNRQIGPARFGRDENLKQTAVQPGFGDMVEDEDYFFRGATSGASYGTCTGLKCNVQVDGPGGFVTTEWQVMSRRQFNFVQPGDSGSLVLNVYGQVAGIVFGGKLGALGIPGYVTPIKTANQSMRERLERELGWEDVKFEWNV